jgi:hypothetical protein
MKMRNSNARNSKRRIAAVAIITLILVGGGGAATYAYWTAGGAGTGTATTGTNSSVTAIQTSVVSGLAPGGTAQTLTGNFTNTNASPVYVTAVTASISSITQAVGAVGTCDSTDYTLSNAAMAVGAEVPSGTAKGAWTGATLAFNDKAGTLQNGCKGATVNIAYSVS